MLLTTEITPVVQYGGWWCKRDDLAYNDGIGACGSKVRQYMAMVAAAPADAALVVGCSSVSAQQVYIADAVRRTGRKGYVVVPKRKVPSEATEWAHAQGCEIVEVDPPAYRNVCMRRMRDLAKTLGNTVQWKPNEAVRDTAEQCANITDLCFKRIVVPTGSGLVAAGIMAGMAEWPEVEVEVVAVAVSELAAPDKITASAAAALRDIHSGERLPKLTFIPPTSRYDKPAFKELPDGTVLDPYYAAKALDYVQPGDLFWVTGCRPLAAMPRGKVEHTPRT